MGSEIDRIILTGATAEGLPSTPVKNPWKLRALAGLLVSALLLDEDGNPLVTEDEDDTLVR